MTEPKPVKITVLSKEGQPSFYVHQKATDGFIVQKIEDDYGRREDGSRHFWKREEEAPEVY